MLKINSENGARYMKLAMALLDVNMSLLATKNADRRRELVSATPRNYFDAEGRIKSMDFRQIDGWDYLAGNSDGPSPTRGSFETQSRLGQFSVSTSPTTFVPADVFGGPSQDYGWDWR